MFLSLSSRDYCMNEIKVLSTRQKSFASKSRTTSRASIVVVVVDVVVVVNY